MSIEYVAGGAFVLLLISVSLWAYDEAVNPKNRILQSEDGLHFPTLRGATHSGKVLVLPAGIEGEIALLIIPFQGERQSELNTWLPIANRLADRYDEFTFYQLSTIDWIPAVAQAALNTEVGVGITDPGTEDSTLTMYLDQASFRQVLGIQNEEDVTVLLINSQGEILWRAEGIANPEGENALRKTISRNLQSG